MMEEQWTEKYRPDDFEGILGHEKVLKNLKTYVGEGSMPHLMFVGQSGVGKTTTALALAKEIYEESWEANFIELTKSEERGINAIRDDVKEKARSRSLTEKDFRIIYMDDADDLTPSAQAAFRRMMENFSENVRFILSCRSLSKIIDPLQSRCAMFRFRPISKDNIERWIRMIEENEGFQIDQDAINVLSRISKGNLREATNLLQVAASMGEEINEEMIKSAIKETIRADIKGMILRAQNGDFMEVREELYDLLIEEGYRAESVLEMIHEDIYNLPMEKEKRKRTAIELGEVDFDIVRGSKSRLHLQRLLAFFAALKEK
ncbi:MAG: replication factor C small subunit [Candidatus Thermoplasmatota archaeon]|nr:replication factor C small subunit [Candidatus Thermoplasmatota archaeon]